MTNQEEIQEKGLQHMRRMRIAISLISISLILGMLWLGMVFENNVFIAYINSRFFLFQMIGCMYAIKITIALIQNHIAKKRGWPAPYGSFKELF